ncbi:hypothetical protein BST13_10215 [Mycobacterium aquaticum]|uniref:Uncharacterized protein n=2 Tax=Mycobacterium aquaticum TaxID=1927124 RepID=A0A1X0B3Y4_9MYCO|nr:hypothetical protein BST13_10215 [Mycobacterium aquaticum]
MQNLVMKSLWKWIGLAGVAGVVAGGVLVARDQRKRNAYTPDDIRARLHQRLADANTPPAT